MFYTTNMSLSKTLLQAVLEDKIWHLNNCEIDYETDPDTGTRAFCIAHNVEVTEVLPNYGYEPDDYPNSPENLNGN